ncbi:hypothetical protein FOH38_05115 [Lysinibacillus fusiformis]|nr:hypothetical protein FOH38_05115 [Lysinibacillus fusiformis]
MEKKQKERLTGRRALNIYGVFTVVSLILSIYTQAVSVNDNMRIFFDSELMLNPREIKEFLIFIFISASMYFIMINFYFWKKEE